MVAANSYWRADRVVPFAALHGLVMTGAELHFPEHLVRGVTHAYSTKVVGSDRVRRVRRRRVAVIIRAIRRGAAERDHHRPERRAGSGGESESHRGSNGLRARSHYSAGQRKLVVPDCRPANTFSKSRWTDSKPLKQNVTLQVAQLANVNLVLEPGVVSEQVVVTGDAGLVDSASSDIGTTVATRQIKDLPLNGRNFTQLATLIPGVSRGVPDNVATGQTNNAGELIEPGRFVLPVDYLETLAVKA